MNGQPIVVRSQVYEIILRVRGGDDVRIALDEEAAGKAYEIVVRVPVDAPVGVTYHTHAIVK